MTARDHTKKLGAGVLRFARQNKIYWIIPLALTLLFALLVALGSESKAPFIYTLF